MTGGQKIDLDKKGIEREGSYDTKIEDSESYRNISKIMSHYLYGESGQEQIGSDRNIQDQDQLDIFAEIKLSQFWSYQIRLDQIVSGQVNSDQMRSDHKRSD